MSLLGWIGELFTGSGVKVMLWKYSEPLKRSAPAITGAALIKSKKDMTITALEIKVIEEYTTTKSDGDEKKTETETTVLGSVRFPDDEAGVGFPFDIKAGEQKEQPFSFECGFTERLQHQKGIMGGIGKLAAFASGDKIEYYITAEATVKGANFTSKDRHKIKVTD